MELWLGILIGVVATSVVCVAVAVLALIIAARNWR